VRWTSIRIKRVGRVVLVVREEGHGGERGEGDASVIGTGGLGLGLEDGEIGDIEAGKRRCTYLVI
jgi:hypothetical protein